MNQLVPNNIQPLRRKLYDLFAAAPLIAMYLFSLTQMLSPLALQIELAKLFIRTDPSVLPPDLVLDIVSKMCTMVFFALLVVMFAVRRVPLHYPIAFYPRFVAGAGTLRRCGLARVLRRGVGRTHGEFAGAALDCNRLLQRVKNRGASIICA